MAWFDWLRAPKTRASGQTGVRAESILTMDLNDPAVVEILRGGATSNSGAVVNMDSAMRVAAVYACVRIIAGAVSSMPLKLYRQDGRKRVEATDNPLHRTTGRPRSAGGT